MSNRPLPVPTSPAYEMDQEWDEDAGFCHEDDGCNAGIGGCDTGIAGVVSNSEQAVNVDTFCPFLHMSTKPTHGDTVLTLQLDFIVKSLGLLDSQQPVRQRITICIDNSCQHLPSVPKPVPLQLGV
ncbi:hypothetical protein M422DRAFT_244577 [Sphaerobolus stellatus SS14]|nr:hypothetical protein M422DRAFT_244577 [Sphaerobolus stellatus SS14]